MSGRRLSVGSPWPEVVEMDVPASMMRGPGNLPAQIVKTLNDEINKALATPELKERLSGEALDPMPMTPDEFARRLKSDYAKYERIIRTTGARAQ